MPGIVLTLMFMAYIALRCILNPALAPPVPPAEKGSTWKGLREVAPMVGLMLVILGSIYLGIATPTEAAAVGAFIAAIIAWVIRRPPLEAYGKALMNTVVISASILFIAIGAFILITTWLPQPKLVGQNRLVQFLGGLVISALSMVVGATGPLIATFIKGLADRRQLVATHAMLMTIQNVMKVLTFTALGFAFGAYLPLIAVMVLAGFVGTAIGSRLLVKVPEQLFRVGFKIVLTLVALDLIRGAVFSPVNP